MSKEGVKTVLALEPRRKPVSEEEAERLVEFFCGKEEEDDMGEIANDMVSGVCCSYCGIYFEEKHGYPVLCSSCAEESGEEEMCRLGYQRAIHEEGEDEPGSSPLRGTTVGRGANGNEPSTD